MPNLLELLQQHGVLIVFAIVLVEQGGMPIPAFPVLIVAGALAVGGAISWPAAMAVAMLACLIADLFWFHAGRAYGTRILRVICRISLSPDSCVSQTEDKFSRYGPKSLLVSKFIPGINAIASPMSGALGVSLPRFLAFSIGGSMLWAGSGIALGAYFHKSVDKVLTLLSTMGTTALIALLAILALFVLVKFVERHRFQRAVQVERISVDDLAGLIRDGNAPVIVDARSATARQLEQAIPDALMFDETNTGDFMSTLQKDRHIIVYCSCPNDVTAAFVAKRLRAHGFHRAQPLHGGLDAWKAHQERRRSNPLSA